jgi:hypothetical protein
MDCSGWDSCLVSAVVSYEEGPSMKSSCTGSSVSLVPCCRRTKPADEGVQENSGTETMIVLP